MICIDQSETKQLRLLVFLAGVIQLMAHVTQQTGATQTLARKWEILGKKVGCVDIGFQSFPDVWADNNPDITPAVVMSVYGRGQYIYVHLVFIG